MSNQKTEIENQKCSAKPGLSFKPWGIRAMLNTKPNTWPAEPIDASKAFKWQTRRVMKDQPQDVIAHYPSAMVLQERGGEQRSECHKGFVCTDGYHTCVAPYHVGQLYYAKETLFSNPYFMKGKFAQCEADNALVARDSKNPEAMFEGLLWRWQGDRLRATRMPRAAARLFYVLRGIRAEQVQNITWQDCQAEGVDLVQEPSPGHWDNVWRERFARRIDEIHPGAWGRNEWHWVYEFAIVQL